MSTLELAGAEYAIEKPGAKHRITMRIIERRYGLNANQLRWFFANIQRKKPRKGAESARD